MAPVPAGGAVAQGHPAHAGGHRGARASRPCASTPRWWRRSAPRTSRLIPVAGCSGRICATPTVDVTECVERIPQFCDETTTAAELLLDQRVAAGVGNVYKSEVLWACGVHPLTPGRRARLGHPLRAVGHRGGVPPGQPRPADPHHPARQRRGRGGLRPLRQALLPVRHADRGPPPRRAVPGDLLVPELPAARGTRGCRRGRRTTRRRRSISTPPGTASAPRPSASTTR